MRRLTALGRAARAAVTRLPFLFDGIDRQVIKDLAIRLAGGEP